MKKLYEYLSVKVSRLRRNTKRTLSYITLPGFEGMPLYDVLVFFFRGISKGVLTYRASAIAYNFFLALIPLILFLFTLIPYVTSSNFQNTVLDLMLETIPSNIFVMVKPTIVEIISRPKSGLLSLGFMMAIYFATNGIDAVLEGFNQTYHRTKKWPWWLQKIYAFLLMVVISFLGFIAMIFLTSGKLIINTLGKYDIITNDTTIYLLLIVQWVIIVSILLLSVSILYYFGHRRDKDLNYRFFSAGSIFSTGLFIVGGLLLKLYFENFSNYNVLYGSIGSLIILLVWLFYNALIILIGFELNTSIKRSREMAIAKYRSKTQNIKNK